MISYNFVLNWYRTIAKIPLASDEGPRMAYLGISKFLRADIRVCDRRYIDRYRSIQPRGSTNERVMPIRFEYHGRLAGTYEKISFLAYVTTNWYETNPFLRSVSMQFLNILSCIPTVSSKDGKYSAHWCLDRVGSALLGTAYFLKHLFVSDNMIHNLTSLFPSITFFF